MDPDRDSIFARGWTTLSLRIWMICEPLKTAESAMVRVLEKRTGALGPAWAMGGRMEWRLWWEDMVGLGCSMVPKIDNVRRRKGRRSACIMYYRCVGKLGAEVDVDADAVGGARKFVGVNSSSPRHKPHRLRSRSLPGYQSRGQRCSQESLLEQSTPRCRTGHQEYGSIHSSKVNEVSSKKCRAGPKEPQLPPLSGRALTDPTATTASSLRADNRICYNAADPIAAPAIARPITALFMVIGPSFNRLLHTSPHTP